MSGGCCCGLTLAQCHALIEVGGRGSLSLIELAGLLDLDVSTLSRTVSGLVLLGMIVRDVNESDRRYLSISLTEQGRKAFKTLDGALTSYYADVLSAIPAGKRDSVIEALTLFSDAVDRLKRRSVRSAGGEDAEKPCGVCSNSGPGRRKK